MIDNKINRPNFLIITVIVTAMLYLANLSAVGQSDPDNCYEFFLPYVSGGAGATAPGSDGDNASTCKSLWATATEQSRPSATGTSTEVAPATEEPTATPRDTNTPVPPTPTNTPSSTPTSTSVSEFTGVDAYCVASEGEAHFEYEINPDAFHLVQARRNGAVVFTSGRSSFSLVEIDGEFGDIIEFTITYQDGQVALETVTMDCLAPPATDVPPTATPEPTATMLPVDLSDFWAQSTACRTEEQGYPEAYNTMLGLGYTGPIDPVTGVQARYEYSVYDENDILQWTSSGTFTVFDTDKFIIELGGYEGYRVDWLVEQFSDQSASWIGVLNGTSGAINCMPVVESEIFYCSGEEYPIASGYNVTIDGAFDMDVIGYADSGTGPVQIFTDTVSGPSFAVGPLETSHPLDEVSFTLSYQGYSIGSYGFDATTCYQDYLAEIDAIDGGNDRNGYGIIITGTEVLSTVVESHHFEVIGSDAGTLAYNTDTIAPTETLTFAGLSDGEVITMTIYSDEDGRVIDQVTHVVSLPSTLTCTNDIGSAPAPVDTVYWDTTGNISDIQGMSSDTFRRQGNITTTVPYSATRGVVAVCYPAVPDEEPTVGIAWLNPEPELGALSGADWATTPITLTPGLQWVTYDGMGEWDADSGPDVTGVLHGVNAYTSLSVGFFAGDVNEPEIVYGPDTEAGEYIHVSGVDVIGRIEGTPANPASLWDVSAVCIDDTTDVEMDLTVDYQGTLGGTATVYSSYSAVIDRDTTIALGGFGFTHTEIYPSGTASISWRIEQGGFIVSSGICTVVPPTP